MGLVLAGSFILFMVLGVPVGLAIGAAGLLVVLLSGFPLAMIPQTMFSGNESFALVAVPFFVLAGDILARGYLRTDRRLCRSHPRRIPGEGFPSSPLWHPCS